MKTEKTENNIKAYNQSINTCQGSKSKGL